MSEKGLLAAKKRREEMKELGIKPKWLTPVEKLAINPKSLRAAINAKCWDCEGRDADPSVSWRIGNCICPDCPLYEVRPHQNMHGTPTPKCLVVSDSEKQV